MSQPLVQLRRHQAALARCRACPKMAGPPVMGEPVLSPVMLVGQAPGSKEIEVHRPFAWTAGRTLFKWFESIGLAEPHFRSRAYMAAVCRCFPGKAKAGGDRVPARDEIAQCSRWIEREIRLLAPRLIVPVGKLAIGLFIDHARLDEVVGCVHRVTVHGVETDVVPLPHPSGASVWHRVEPGKTLLREALACIDAHPAWQMLRGTSPTR